MPQLEPTEAQKKEFWMRLLGRQFIIDNCLAEDLPIDLNNLFKYAVPKPKSKMFLVFWAIRLLEGYAEGKNPNPALALFWAIWEVIHDK